MGSTIFPVRFCCSPQFYDDSILVGSTIMGMVRKTKDMFYDDSILVGSTISLAAVGCRERFTMIQF